MNHLFKIVYLLFTKNQHGIHYPIASRNNKRQRRQQQQLRTVVVVAVAVAAAVAVAVAVAVALLLLLLLLLLHPPSPLCSLVFVVCTLLNGVVQPTYKQHFN